jgi:DNA replication protein DnaC
MRNELRTLIETLKLRGMAGVLDAELDRAEREASPLAEVIYRLLAQEEAHRRERSLANRLKEAQLPWRWSLDSFPFERQSALKKSQILTLAGLDFLRRNENLVLIGPTGVGKSGIAIALLREACLNGFRGRFYASLADRSTTKLLTRLSRYQPLLIDEIGYLSLKPEQVNAFFRLMDQRYGRVSTILTTNLEYSDWYALFQNKPLVDALLDRLQHHCISIRINGPSLRDPEATPSNRSKPATSSKPTKQSAK